METPQALIGLYRIDERRQNLGFYRINQLPWDKWIANCRDLWDYWLYRMGHEITFPGEADWQKLHKRKICVSVAVHDVMNDYGIWTPRDSLITEPSYFSLTV